MNSYLRKLDLLSKASQQLPSVRPEERRDSHQALKENDIVAVLADDNPNYYFTVRLGRNYTGQLVPQWSNAIYGSVPDGIPVVPHTAVRKYQRMGNLQNLNAGVFSGGYMPPQGAVANELVTDLHKSLLRGTGQ